MRVRIEEFEVITVLKVYIRISFSGLELGGVRWFGGLTAPWNVIIERNHYRIHIGVKK